MSNKLKTATYETMKHLKKNEIVLPSDYSKEFEKISYSLGIELGNQEILMQELSQDFAKLDKIVAQTNENLNALEQNTASATKAIEKQDIAELSKIKSNIKAMQDQIAFLQQELFTDSLTKAHNRKWFNDHFLAQDHFKSDGFMAFLDLNNFKNINDSYGHIIGDMVLRYLVDFSKKELKTLNPKIVRYAGDEFLILFDAQNNLIALEKMLHDLQVKLYKQTLSPKNDKSTTFHFSFSFGIAPFKNGDIFSHTIELADQKMYANKVISKQTLFK